MKKRHLNKISVEACRATSFEPQRGKLPLEKVNISEEKETQMPVC
jgi:hypothetical protein